MYYDCNSGKVTSTLPSCTVLDAMNVSDLEMNIRTYGTDHFQRETRVYRIASVHNFIARLPLKHAFFAFFLDCATAPVSARVRFLRFFTSSLTSSFENY